jgi:hypothetical protein
MTVRLKRCRIRRSGPLSDGPRINNSPGFGAAAYAGPPPRERGRCLYLPRFDARGLPAWQRSPLTTLTVVSKLAVTARAASQAHNNLRYRSHPWRNEACAHEGGGASEWTAEDLEQVERYPSPLCVCTTRGLGLTARFGLSEEAVSAAAGDRTAMFQEMADQPHPERNTRNEQRRHHNARPEPMVLTFRSTERLGHLAVATRARRW